MSGRSGCKGYRYIETATAVALGSGGAAAMALRAACSGIEIQDLTHTSSQQAPYSKTVATKDWITFKVQSSAAAAVTS